MLDSARAALLIVDVQVDFMPGGSLAVAAGDAIVEPLGRLMRAGIFAKTAATQDWHPRGHVSFASSHPGKAPFDTIILYGREQVLWPDHCVQGTPGADLRPGLPWERVGMLVRKGTDPEVDSYSGFRNNWNRNRQRPATGLGGYLKDLGITDLYVCGLARDICVKWTVEDALDLGFKTSLLWDLTRAVDPSTDTAVREELSKKGAAILDSSTLL